MCCGGAIPPTARKHCPHAYPLAWPGNPTRKTAKDCAVACKVVVLPVRPRLCGATICACAPAVTRVPSNLYFTVIVLYLLSDVTAP